MMKTLKTSKILGIGSFVPPRVVTNNDLSQFMDTSDEWIQTRSGIQERHWVDPSVTTSDLGVEAAKAALKSAQVDKKEIDMILFATLSPDHEFPGTACFFQAKMEMGGIPAMDIRQQCSGFLYALSVADQFIKTGTYKKILVIGAEVHSKGLDLTTDGRDVTVLFGDGAGAMVVGAIDETDQKPIQRDQSQIYTTHIHADGSYAKELWVPAPGLAQGALRITSEMLDQKEQYPKMNGKTVFLNAVKKMPEVLMEALEASHFTLDQVDLFIFHQANIRINEAVAKQLKIPEEKVFNTIQRFGNTTAATIPIGLDEAVKAGKLKKGMLVASAAFGSGFTWASAVYRW
jgi:3-oxoacyl-[acyl-carrier-protein] synthase-3